jgi:hypothetical protein
MAMDLKSRHQLGGFTLFMFKPTVSLQRRTKDETEAMLRSAMGKYEVNNKVLRDLAKTDWHLPMDVDLALRQIWTGWNFGIDVLPRYIAANNGCHYGEKVLKRHRYRFAEALDSDKLFLVIYVHLLDLVFQAFLGELVRYLGQAQPIPEATRCRLANYMENRVMNAHARWTLDRPHMVLPKGISDTA